MNGLIYCRVSSREQIEGTSLESQESACVDYARQHGITVLKVFVEQGESAKFADRTQLLQLIDFCQKNKGNVQALLVWKLDRFARNVSDHYSVKATLAKYGVRIISVTEPIDTKPEGKLLETILAGFAQFDNDIRAMRTVQGMRRKIQEGIFPWRPPLGYKSSVSSREKKNLPDTPDQPTFDLLRRAWEHFTTGAYTQAEIGILMTSWGITTARRGSFSPQSLFNLFTNPYYAGILVDRWDGKEYEGKHLPMVTRDQFAAVQRVIASRSRSIRHQKFRPEFPLRGLVRCDLCSHALTAAFSRGRSRMYGYYVCHGDACAKRGKSYRAEVLHEEFELLLDRIAPNRELLAKLREHILGRLKQRQQSQAVQKAQRRDQAAHLDRELQELVRMRTKDLITDEEFMRQRRIIVNQGGTFTHEAPDVLDVSSSERHLQEITEPLMHLRQTWRALKGPVQRRFERLIVPVGFVVGQSRTAELGHLFRTFGELQSPPVSSVPSGSTGSNQIMQDISAFAEIFQLAKGSSLAA
jgi:DNA invertase Pin-like site-specific DNA recombinase